MPAGGAPPGGFPRPGMPPPGFPRPGMPPPGVSRQRLYAEPRPCCEGACAVHCKNVIASLIVQDLQRPLNCIFLARTHDGADGHSCTCRCGRRASSRRLAASTLASRHQGSPGRSSSRGLPAERRSIGGVIGASGCDARSWPVFPGSAAGWLAATISAMQREGF